MQIYFFLSSALATILTLWLKKLSYNGNKSTLRETVINEKQVTEDIEDKIHFFKGGLIEHQILRKYHKIHLLRRYHCRGREWFDQMRWKFCKECP